MKKELKKSGGMYGYGHGKGYDALANKTREKLKKKC